MAISLSAPTNILPVPGVRIATIAAEIRYQGRDDLVLFEFAEQANTAAVFTKNQFCAAPVLLAKKHLQSTQPKYLLINSGNANAGMGEQGLSDALTSCNVVARACQCEVEEVLPFSTGVIGQRLPVEKIINHIPHLYAQLKQDTWLNAAKAIMTTDTVPKVYSKQLDLDGHKVVITGIAKGAGMIQPDMATMLAFVATDLGIASTTLQDILSTTVAKSFNCITVDGDTSTNDACVLTATGAAGIYFAELSAKGQQAFSSALQELFIFLAQAIIRDAEGVTKFISVKVEQAHSVEMAKSVAFTIANSPLVKTAAFASDPNWGRILAAAGRAPVEGLRANKFCLYINDVQIVENGELSVSYTEEKGTCTMQKDELEFRLQLGLGQASANIWTTDLSYEYIKINAEYRT